MRITDRKAAVGERRVEGEVKIEVEGEVGVWRVWKVSVGRASGQEAGHDLPGPGGGHGRGFSYFYFN